MLFISQLYAQISAVYDLETDQATNPLGIDNTSPTLSWKIQSNRDSVFQTSFQIQIAISKYDLINEENLLVDKKINNDFNAFQVQNLDLVSRQRYWWRVKVWDNYGATSTWSAANWWEMALLKESDWQANWIRHPDFLDDSLAAKPAPYFRKDFQIKALPDKARVYVTGLGYYQLFINGEKVGDEQLAPAKTRYDKRVKYQVFDVTNLLKVGDNTVGAILGTGWYNHFANAVWGFNKAPWRSYPELLCQLEINLSGGESITIATDKTWQTAQGPILFDGIRNGETYDARLAMPGWNETWFDASDWSNAVEVDGPQGKLSVQVMEPIKEIMEIKPVSVTEIEPNVWVFDLGQNIAGYARLRTAGPAGTKVTLKHGEKLYPDGRVEQKQILRFLKSGEAQTDTYILRGDGVEEFHPHFVYHGFQYVEVRGLAHPPTLETLTGVVLHTAFEEVGDFMSSDPVLNRLQQNMKWSFVGNYHGLPTDCPHREKIGWTGDAQLVAETGLLNFDVYKAYVKWLEDFVDEQQPSGDLPGIIPSSGWGYEHGRNPETRPLGYGPQWEGAFVQMTWDVFIHSGDTAVLKKFYEPIKKYISFLLENAEDYTLNFGIDDHKPVSTKTEGDILASGYLYHFVKIMESMAAVTGKSEDAAYYASLQPKIEKGFNKKYFDKKTALYGNKGQTSQTLALYFDLVPKKYKEAVLNNLLKNIEERNYHFDVGVVGLKFLFNVLTEKGHAETLYKMVTQKDIPGFAYWLEQGANTLWQDWDGSMSLNHIMFATVNEWFFESLAGIRRDEKSPGMRHVFIKPDLIPQLNWASANHENRYGQLVSSWNRTEQGYEFKLEIPINTTASFYVPENQSTFTLNGQELKSQGANVYEHEGDKYLKLASGSYSIIFD